MPLITDIKKAKSKNKYHVYLDDRFFCTIEEFTLYKNKLSCGLDIEEDKLADIISEDESTTAFEKVIDLISVSPKTEQQVYEYLVKKGYPKKLCTNTVNKLKSYKYLDDSQYANTYIETYKYRYGKQKLKFNLIQKGVDKNIIESALEDMEAQDEVVKSLAQKYLKGKILDKGTYEKTVRFLAGKGFGFAEIQNALNELKEGCYEDRN